MKGRLFLCPYWGSELNTGNLDQVIERTPGIQGAKQYPLAIMMPPRSAADYATEGGTRDEHQFTIFFLKQSHVTSERQIQSLDRDTNRSLHKITDDWHDMKRCAVAFMKVLGALMENGVINQYFYVSERSPQNITPVSTIGNDKVSGVMLQLTGTILTACELEDYPENFLTGFQMPALDPHPEHTL